MKPSKSRANKAGELLRDWYSGQSGLVSPTDTGQAFDVIAAFRKQWVDPPRPYATVYARLWEFAGEAYSVSRRLKRVDRIVQKLVRFPSMRVARMEDIAGCRVVVPDLTVLETARAFVHARWPGQVSRERDYISSPRSTGYRAVHLVVRHHGLPVEVQLRTVRQQRWAEEVEHQEDRGGALLKDGQGPEDMLRHLREISDRLYLEDRGLHPTAADETPEPST